MAVAREYYKTMSDQLDYQVSLRIWHPNISPGKISEYTGLSPDVSWEAGTPRTTPSGSALGGAHRESYWSCRLSHGLEVGLADFLGSFVAHFVGLRQFFQEISRTGGRVELFISLAPVAASAGELFTHELLSSLGELSIDISMDIYRQ